MDDSYSQINGRGNKENWQEEVAVKAYFLYMDIFLSDDEAFPLPAWFVESRKKFTKEEVKDMLNEVQQLGDDNG